MNRNNELGRSMVEILGVLAIVGMVSMSIGKLISSMHDRYRISRVTQQITDLRKSISNRYTAYGDYTVIKTADIIADKILPGDMVEGNKVFHSFNGEVIFAGTQDTYEITFKNLPQNACLELSLMNWQFNGDSDLYKIKINDTEFNWPVLAGENGKKMPVAIVDATAACSKDDNSNIIVWTFR